MAGPITVALCEDHGVFRRELLVSLEKDPLIHVVAEADVPGHLGPLVADHPPRVLCLDLTPPVGDPVDGVRRLLAAMPMTAILALVGPRDDAASALVAGAAGAVEKQTALLEAPAIVHTLAAGNVHLDAEAARSLLSHASRHPTTDGSNPLSSGQRELLHQIGSGRHIEELAEFFECDAEAVHQRVWETLVSLRERERSDDQIQSSMAPALPPTSPLAAPPRATAPSAEVEHQSSSDRSQSR